MHLGSGIWAITSDLSIPANVNLKLERNTRLTISGGKTLTILGTIETGNYQVFDCSAGGKIAFRVDSLVNTAWFGGLADLVAGLSGNNHIKVILNESETISRNLTLPPYVTLQINRGPVLTMAASKVLTINRNFEAGGYHVFTDQNTGLNGVAFGTTSVNVLYPEWWGAVGDYTSDDTDAVQAAFNAQYGIQHRSCQARAFGNSNSFPVVPVGFSPNRFYSCNPLIVQGLISMVVLGGDVFGAQPLIYSKSAASNANLFTITPFYDDTSISLKCEGLAFASNLKPGQTRRYYFYSPNPYGGKTLASNSLYWRRCRFGTTSASGSCIYLENSSDVEISHCIFDASGADEGVIRFKNGSDVRIHDNEFYHCQYGIVAGEYLVGTISGNIFRNMGVGACVALLNGRDTGMMDEPTFLAFTGNSIDSKVATKDYNFGILIGGTLGKCHVTSVGNT